MTTSELLEVIMPALERASGISAKEFRKLNLPQSEFSEDENAALWLARAILEATDNKKDGEK